VIPETNSATTETTVVADPECAPRGLARPTAHRRRARPFARRESASLERHARKCAVCRHKHRADIELDFLHWFSAESIAHEYDLESAAIYRHAHATGLFNERMTNIRFAAVHIAERAESVTPTASSVLHAIRACTLIDDEGKWNDPPKRIIVEHRNVTQSEAESVANSAPETAISNRNFQKLETPATPTKQTTEPKSNRNFRSTKIDPPQATPARSTTTFAESDRGSP
jgi:hypothetical protein